MAKKLHRFQMKPQIIWYLKQALILLLFVIGKLCHQVSSRLLILSILFFGFIIFSAYNAGSNNLW